MKHCAAPHVDPSCRKTNKEKAEAAAAAEAAEAEAKTAAETAAEAEVKTEMEAALTAMGEQDIIELEIPEQLEVHQPEATALSSNDDGFQISLVRCPISRSARDSTCSHAPLSCTVEPPG